VEDGHARRVGRLAVLTGRELGMSEPQLLELE
jgi:HD-GYP domain-containing protein (c-di-GMP phosphodiesterase class II)